MMRDVICYWEDRVCTVPTDGMVVIGAGNAPLWQVCKLFQKAVMHGASVIAVGPGADITTNHKEYVVAYSLDEEYPIGSCIPVDMIFEDHIKGLPEF